MCVTENRKNIDSFGFKSQVSKKQLKKMYINKIKKNTIVNYKKKKQYFTQRVGHCSWCDGYEQRLKSLT